MKDSLVDAGHLLTSWHYYYDDYRCGFLAGRFGTLFFYKNLHLGMFVWSMGVPTLGDQKIKVSMGRVICSI